MPLRLSSFAHPAPRTRPIHENRRRHCRDPEARGRRGADRLSGQPPDRGCGRRRHPADHGAPGAHGAAHGRCHHPRDQRRPDRRVLHAARAGHRERLWRHRAGVERVDPDAGHSRRLRAQAGLGRPQLQCQPADAGHHQVGRADPIRQGHPRHPAPCLPAPALRARRPRRRRGAAGRVAGDDRHDRLHAAEAAARRT